MSRALFFLAVAGCLLAAPLSQCCAADAPTAPKAAASEPLEPIPADMPVDLRKRVEKMPAHQRADIIQHWLAFQNLSPQARKVLEQNYATFKKMPPAQREQLRAKLKQFESMSAEDKEKLQDNLKRWQALSPQEQDKLRKQVRAEQKKAAPTSIAGSNQVVRVVPTAAEAQSK